METRNLIKYRAIIGKGRGLSKEKEWRCDRPVTDSPLGIISVHKCS